MEVKPLHELMTEEEMSQLISEQINEIEQLREEVQRLEIELMVIR